MKNDLMKQPSGKNKLIKNIGFGLIVADIPLLYAKDMGIIAGRVEFDDGRQCEIALGDREAAGIGQQVAAIAAAQHRRVDAADHGAQSL